MLNRLKITAVLLFWAAISPLLMGAQGNQVLPTTGTVSGLTMTTDTNAALAALNSCNSGASAPANGVGGVAVQGQCWLDTSGAFPVVKIYDGTNWVLRDVIDTTNHIQWDKNGPVATTTGTNTFVLTATYAPTTLVDGMSIRFRIGTSNTAATTLNLNSTGAKPLRSSPSTEFASGVLLIGSVYSATYKLSTTEWIADGFYTITSSQQVPAGSEFMFSGFTVPAGFLFENGSSQLRTTYAALFAVITQLFPSATCSNGSAIISALSSTTDLSPGWQAEDSTAHISSSLTIKSVDSATQVTMSGNLTGTCGTVTFFPHGFVDTTHFNLPNWNGYTPLIQDNLGGTAANVAQISTTLTTVSGSATCPAAGCVVGTSANMAVGMYIQAAGVPVNTTIATIVDATHITLSANATASATVNARFSPITDANGVGQTGGALVHTQIRTEVGVHAHADNLAISSGVPRSCAVTGNASAPPNNYSNMAHSCLATAVISGGVSDSAAPQPANTYQKSKITKMIIKY